MDGKKTHVSLLMALHGHPFAITEEGLAMIVAIASRQQISAELLQEYRRQDAERPPSAFMKSPGSLMEGARRLRLREGGVGVLAVRGPMVRHADLLDEISGATSMATIAKEIQFGLDSKDVKSMVLDIESPGGELPAELAEMIREADQQKPVTAYVGHWGMSSAYWIGTGAGRLIAHPTAFVGSVGVRTTFVDTSKLEESLGIQTIEMMASQSPHKVSDPMDPDGRARIQALLDVAYEDFRDGVAANLGVSRKRVQEDFGKGAAVHARKAAAAGMIHGLDTMEGVIAAVSGGRRYRSTRSAVGSPGAQAMGRTWNEFWAALGIKGNDPVPGLDSDPAPMVATQPPSSAQEPDSDDPAELRRRLKASEDARIAAEKRADEQASGRQQEAVAAQERDIRAQVRAWVGKKIHPAESAAIEQTLLALAAADRANGTSFHGKVVESIQARPTLHTLDETVVTGKIPAGGHIVDPPISPETPEGGDPWAKDRDRMLQASANGHSPK
jgi:ClpP class serine protease